MEDKIALDADDIQTKTACAAKLVEVKEWLDTTYQEMQARFDNRPERWQESDTGRAAADWIAEFDSIAGDVESLADRLDQLANKP